MLRPDDPASEHTLIITEDLSDVPPSVPSVDVPPEATTNLDDDETIVDEATVEGDIGDELPLHLVAVMSRPSGATRTVTPDPARRTISVMVP